MRAQKCGVMCPHCGAYTPDKRCFWILFWLSLFAVLAFAACFAARLFARYIGV